jgi:hypothetical protein
MEPHGKRSACFTNVASATFTGDPVDALCYCAVHSGSLSSLVFMSELLRAFLVLKIVLVSITNTFELLRNTLHIWNIHRAQRLLPFTQMTATLGINDRVNETLGITVELDITSQAADFFNQNLSFLAYG